MRVLTGALAHADDVDGGCGLGSEADQCVTERDWRPGEGEDRAVVVGVGVDVEQTGCSWVLVWVCVEGRGLVFDQGEEPVDERAVSAL